MAAASAAALEDILTIGVAHANAESMGFVALTVVGLERSFHSGLLLGEWTRMVPEGSNFAP